MFSFHTSLNKIYEIKWKITKSQSDILASKLYVEFKPENDYYIIDKILYTYVDILVGLFDIDFELIKQNGEITLNIIKM